MLNISFLTITCNRRASKWNSCGEVTNPSSLDAAVGARHRFILAVRILSMLRPSPLTRTCSTFSPTWGTNWCRTSMIICVPSCDDGFASIVPKQVTSDFIDIYSEYWCGTWAGTIKSWHIVKWSTRILFTHSFILFLSVLQSAVPGRNDCGGSSAAFTVESSSSCVNYNIKHYSISK